MPPALSEPPYTGHEIAVRFPAWQGGELPLLRGLYGTFPAFRRAFDHACRALDELLPLPLAAAVFAQRDGADAWLLHSPRYGRPALFAYQLALFALWREWGLPVGAVSGEGTGAVGAAHAAGLLELDAAARRVVRRERVTGAGAGAGVGAPSLAGFPVVLVCGPGPGTDSGFGSGSGSGSGSDSDGMCVGVGRAGALLDALAALQERGTPLDWTAVRYGLEGGRRPVVSGGLSAGR